MNKTNALIGDLRLRFNIDHPSIEDCYCFGYECAAAELEESENPFDEGSAEHQQWLEGWWAGFYGEPPIFELDAEYEETNTSVKVAANDDHYQQEPHGLFKRWMKITGAIAASAVVGYQVIDLVA